MSIATASDFAAAAAALQADMSPSATPSIRVIIVDGIRKGKSTAEIAAAVALHHPSSAAAAKSGKHIAYYRSLEKQGRNGKIPAEFWGK